MADTDFMTELQGKNLASKINDALAVSESVAVVNGTTYNVPAPTRAGEHRKIYFTGADNADQMTVTVTTSGAMMRDPSLHIIEYRTTDAKVRSGEVWDLHSPDGTNWTIQAAFRMFSSIDWRENHDGKVTLWGILTTGTSQNVSRTITLPAALKNVNYIVTVLETSAFAATDTDFVRPMVHNVTATSFDIRNSGPRNGPYRWVLENGVLDYDAL